MFFFSHNLIITQNKQRKKAEKLHVRTLSIIYFSALNFSTLKVPCVTMYCKFDCVNKNYVNYFAFFINKIGFLHCYPTIQTFGYPHRAVFLKLLVINKTRKTTKQIFIYHKNTFKNSLKLIFTMNLFSNRTHPKE